MGDFKYRCAHCDEVFSVALDAGTSTHPCQNCTKAATLIGSPDDSRSVMERDIRNAWIAAIVAATLSLVALIFLVAGAKITDINAGVALLEVAFLYFLAYCVARNSRLAIIALIAHVFYAKLQLYWVSGNILHLAVLAGFGYLYILGAIAIFKKARLATG